MRPLNLSDLYLTVEPLSTCRALPLVLSRTTGCMPRTSSCVTTARDSSLNGLPNTTCRHPDMSLCTPGYTHVCVHQKQRKQRIILSKIDSPIPTWSLIVTYTHGTMPPSNETRLSPQTILSPCLHTGVGPDTN